MLPFKRLPLVNELATEARRGFEGQPGAGLSAVQNVSTTGEASQLDRDADDADDRRCRLSADVSSCKWVMAENGTEKTQHHVKRKLGKRMPIIGVFG